MDPEVDLKIDLMALEEEWVKQPDLVFQASDTLAEARKNHEERKFKLELLKVRLSDKVRKNPKHYGILKLTEKAVEQAAITNPLFSKSQEAVIAARYDMDKASALVTALENKKKALESLVFLHGQNYFSAPKENKTRRGKRTPRS